MMIPDTVLLCSALDMGHPLIHHLCFLLLSVLACQCPAVSGLFEWLKRTEAPPAAAPPAAAAAVPALVAKDAQFEMGTADEKFLAEAKHMEISPLDNCHYRVKLSPCSLKSRVSHSPLSLTQKLQLTSTFLINWLVYKVVEKSHHSFVVGSRPAEGKLWKPLRGAAREAWSRTV